MRYTPIERYDSCCCILIPFRHSHTSADIPVLAWLSLTLQLFALLVTILLTLYFVRTTTAEQALESRSFLPSPWHLNSADLLEQAQKGKEGLKSGVDWGKGKIGEVWDGDEA